MNPVRRNIIILVNTETKPDRECIRGVLRYASRRPEWNVFLLTGHPANQSTMVFGNRAVDGLIATNYMLDHCRRTASETWESAKHVVIIEAQQPSPLFPRRRQILIANDSAECGRLAARFYLNRSFRHLAYVHMLLSRRWSNERAQAFQKEASKAGATCAVYLPPNDTDTDWSVECCRLGAWLRTLPKPCGILAANDNRAIQVIQLCHDLDIAIPDQISVLGVDDDDILCDTCRPRLSSISPDFQTGGYMAAKALDEMLTTGKKPSDRLSYGEPAIIERESTYDPKGTTRIVSCARDFIRQHHQDNIGTKDIATAVGVSSRTLERRFIASTGLSPLASLTKARLEHARNLLLSSSTPIGEIFKIVGFGSPSRLAVAFKQEYGKTMRHMRQEDSAPQSQRPRF